MKRRISAIAASTVLIGLAACTAQEEAGAHAPAPAILVLTEADSGQARSIPHDGTIEVRLSARLGTGFGWRRIDTAPIESIGEPTTRPASGEPGAPETQVFRLRAATRGRHELRYVYEQPFVGGEKNARSARFTIQVG